MRLEAVTTVPQDATPARRVHAEDVNAASPEPVPRWAWALPGLTVALQSVMFVFMNPAPASPNLGILAFVCLVPWLMFLARPLALRTAVLTSYGCGVAFYLVNTYYLMQLTLAGYLAMAAYLGLFYALFGAGVWFLYHHGRWPLAFAAPLLWVVFEYLRSVGPLALPLLFLSHGLYRSPTLIQISDLTGALGVSGVVAMVGGLLADLALRLRAGGSRPPRRVLGPAITTLLLTAATVLYGVIRLDDGRLVDGPRIAVVQGDYPLTLQGTRVSGFEKRSVYLELARAALARQPDLLLMPETPWPMILNEEFLQAEKLRSDFDREMQAWSLECDAMLRQLARDHDVTVVIGAGSMEFFPHAVYPKYRKYNSAFVYDPRGAAKRRYDKVALVMFGEYTPFRSGRLHWLYRKLDSFNPFSSPDDEFSLTPGEDFGTFEFATGDGRRYTFGVPICFEDLIPQIGRAFRIGPDGERAADFLLSISNDGWFNYGAVVAQHLAVCAFRAVENRVGIARSVNTACSGFIDPNGRLHDLVSLDGRILGPGIFGFAVADITIDPQVTVYSRFGDWFGISCLMLSVLGISATALRSRPPRS